jgi:hypothetical protein
MDNRSYNLVTFLLVASSMNTTRKSEKSNGITDGIFPSVIYTDGNNFVSKSVGIYRRNKSVGDTVGIYRQCRRRSIQFIWNIRNIMVMSGDFID